MRPINFNTKRTWSTGPFGSDISKTNRHKDMIEIIKDTTNMWIIKNQINKIR